jgi:uncharacterized protein (TIGR01244 family)
VSAHHRAFSRGNPAFLLTLAIVLLTAEWQASAQGAPSVQKQDVPGIVNFSRVDATIGCGGATTPEAYARLTAFGFRSVINLREHGEPGADIDQAREAASLAGLRFVHLPLNGRQPDPRVVAAFLEAVADPANQPAYIHCGSANRVGAVWYVKRVLQDGWTEERAMDEALAIGLSSPEMKRFATEYVRASVK